MMHLITIFAVFLLTPGSLPAAVPPQQSSPAQRPVVSLTTIPTAQKTSPPLRITLPTPRPAGSKSSDVRVRVCGRHLADALSVVCQGLGGFYEPSKDQYKQAGPGVVDECCRQGCTLTTLQSYCKNSKPEETEMDNRLLLTLYGQRGRSLDSSPTPKPRTRKECRKRCRCRKRPRKFVSDEFTSNDLAPLLGTVPPFLARSPVIFGRRSFAPVF